MAQQPTADDARTDSETQTDVLYAVYARNDRGTEIHVETFDDRDAAIDHVVTMNEESDELTYYADDTTVAEQEARRERFNENVETLRDVADEASEDEDEDNEESEAEDSTIMTDGGRFVPEGDGDMNPYQEGDRVAYAGNGDFEGTVVRVSRRTVVVESDDGEVKSYDCLDLKPSPATGASIVETEEPWPGAFEDHECPVCGSDEWVERRFSGVFCEACNCQVSLERTTGDPGFIARYDSHHCWAPEMSDYEADGDMAVGEQAVSKFLTTDTSGETHTYERLDFRLQNDGGT